MLFSSFFSSLGGALGSGAFSAIGRLAGSLIGKYFDESSYEPIERFRYAKQMDLLYLNADVIGKTIPIVLGKARVFGHIIWAKPIKMQENDQTGFKYFKNNDQVKSIEHNISYTYYATFALGICEGEISEISKIWANDCMLDLQNYQYTLYRGSKEQKPDPAIYQEQGDKTPAFRDLAYIVFKDFPLAEFSNKIPIFSFEVIKKTKDDVSEKLENMIKSITMIPGSGEFVYDTIIQYKNFYNPYGKLLSSDAINLNNHKNIADSLYSLDQLMTTCPNLESISVVVSWFADSLDIKNCSILPAVEYNNKNVNSSENWLVAMFNRHNAKLIGSDNGGLNPRYGGTVNDQSLLRYLAELKRRNLQVVLYPMIFLDLPGKPWRGHITGAALDVEQFFNKKDGGYNEFILHYAQLAKDLVDVFIIGSELKGITAISEQTASFPAVDQLVKLADKVRHIMGERVKLTYAADWSEYHHSHDGWFNMDSLWASPAIDFVGIDAYFPLTRTQSSQISQEQIIHGWQAEEGFDYYFDKEGNKILLQKNYAWKDFEYWWNNYHINPDGKQSSWRPKMKKVWFSEFGFPSIDKAPNQPNIFYDPNCLDGGVPIYSNGATDLFIQRQSIKASLKYWQNSQIVEKMYLWTWDARPYPTWPHKHIWADGNLWEKGHWLNGKLAFATLEGVVRYICSKAGIDDEQIIVNNLDYPIEGIVLDKNISCRQAIDLLRCCYFFDIYCQKDKLVFCKRSHQAAIDIDSASLLCLNAEGSYFNLRRLDDTQAVNQVVISFFDQIKKYALQSIYLNVDFASYCKKYFIHLPIVMQEAQAQLIAQMIVGSNKAENTLISFALSLDYIYLQPTDLINLTLNKVEYRLRIIDISLDGLMLKISAVSQDCGKYLMLRNTTWLQAIDEPKQACIILQLPYLPWLDKGKNYVHVFYNYQPMNLYISLDGESFDLVQLMPGNSCIGQIIAADLYQEVSSLLVDEKSSFTIRISYSFILPNEKNFWHKNNLAIVGQELIRFRKMRYIGGDLYQISGLIRGEFATERYINMHDVGENFALINQGAAHVNIAECRQVQKLHFKINNQLYHFINKN